MLRWFEEVHSLTLKLEKEFSNDVDILFAVADLKKLVQIASKHPDTFLLIAIVLKEKRKRSARISLLPLYWLTRF